VYSALKCVSSFIARFTVFDSALRESIGRLLANTGSTTQHREDSYGRAFSDLCLASELQFRRKLLVRTIFLNMTFASHDVILQVAEIVRATLDRNFPSWFFY
jgi:hypothetical protein